MGIEKVEHLEDKTVVSIHEPTRYGKLDSFREITIPHDPEYRTELDRISPERIQRPSADPYGAGVEEIELVEVERVGTVAFVKDFDVETGSATYRSGAHSLRGPYLVVSDPPALFVTLEAVRADVAVQEGGRGDRKILVTELYAEKEDHAEKTEWQPPTTSGKCPVQVMKDTEVAVFTQYADQDRHFHKIGTEIYTVLEGKMIIEVEGRDYTLSEADMIVVNPGAAHQVKPDGTQFICRVVTVNCGGASDKYQA